MSANENTALKWSRRIIIISASLLVVVAAVVAILLFNPFNSINPVLTVDEMLDLGEKFLLDMDYEQALAQFLGVIEIEPKIERGYTGAAEAYIGLGDTDGAQTVLRQGMEQLPDNAAIQELLDGISATPEPTPVLGGAQEPIATPEPVPEPTPDEQTDADTMGQATQPFAVQPVLIDRLGITLSELKNQVDTYQIEGPDRYYFYNVIAECAIGRFVYTFYAETDWVVSDSDPCYSVFARLDLLVPDITGQMSLDDFVRSLHSVGIDVAYFVEDVGGTAYMLNSDLQAIIVLGADDGSGEEGSYFEYRLIIDLPNGEIVSPESTAELRLPAWSLR